MLHPGDQHLDFNRIHPLTSKASDPGIINLLRNQGQEANSLAPPKYFKLAGDCNPMQTSPSAQSNFNRKKRKSLLPKLNN